MRCALPGLSFHRPQVTRYAGTDHAPFLRPVAPHSRCCDAPLSGLCALLLPWSIPYSRARYSAPFPSLPGTQSVLVPGLAPPVARAFARRHFVPRPIAYLCRARPRRASRTLSTSFLTLSPLLCLRGPRRLPRATLRRAAPLACSTVIPPSSRLASIAQCLVPR